MGHAAPALDQHAEALLHRGKMLLKQGKLRKASEALRQAVNADPCNALTHAWLGYSLVRTSQNVRTRSAMCALLNRAEIVLHEALSLEWNIEPARSAIQQLSAALYTPSRRNSGVVEKHIVEGHRHFTRGEQAAALERYEHAMAIDPSHAAAWKFAGNCHFNGGRYGAAELHFRTAVEHDPLDPQAHLFLADTLLEQRNYLPMWSAVYGAIAAHPRYWSAWLRLDELLEPIHRRLTAFNLRPAVHLNHSGKVSRLTIDSNTPPHLATAWSVYASSKLDTQGRTAFAIERDALRALAEHLNEVGTRPTAPTFPLSLRLLSSIYERDELDAATFILRYDESFRDDFEIWKSGGGSPVQSHAMRWKLRPI